MKKAKKPVFMRVSGLGKMLKNTSLHQTYIKWCRVLCRDEKIA